MLMQNTQCHDMLNDYNVMFAILWNIHLNGAQQCVEHLFIFLTTTETERRNVRNKTVN